MQCLPISNSNLVYVNGDCPLQTVKPGDYLQIENTSNVFLIQKCEKTTFSYPSVFENSLFKVTETLHNLQPGDSFNLIYEAFEVSCCIILEPGTKFEVGQTFAFGGKETAIQLAAVKVASVDHLGRIKHLEIDKKGIYTSGNSKILPISSNGSEAKIEIIFQSIGRKHRTLIIKSIHHDNNNTYLSTENLEVGVLNSPLIQVEKYEIEVNSKFVNSIGKKECNFLVNFTKHLSMPLLSINSLDPAPIINNNLIIIDLKLKELEDKIKALSLV